MFDFKQFGNDVIVGDGKSEGKFIPDKQPVCPQKQEYYDLKNQRAKEKRRKRGYVTHAYKDRNNLN